MRKLLFILLLLPLQLFGETYYVATTGNDGNAGTIGSPWLTLQYAWSQVSAGDIVYLRGGTYEINGDGISGTECVLSGLNGSVGNLIKFWNYPGEIPLFKPSGTFTGNELVYIQNSSYIHFKGFEVAHYAQTRTVGYSAMFSNNVNNCIYERINYHHNGGPFIVRGTVGSSNNLVLNCDFWRNYDPMSTIPYGNCDGFDFHYIATGSVGNVVRGCRAWNNADDGFDCWENNGIIRYDSCWSWGNGYREDRSTTGGDGTGYKLGYNASSAGTRTVTNCLSFYNRTGGFNRNAAISTINNYNNIAYNNGYIGFLVNASGWGDYYGSNKNNISYLNSATYYADGSNTTADHNSWQDGLSVSSGDFVSLDTAGVSGTRQSNGSLPILSFLKLANGSDLIDVGIYVGLDFEGTAPDIGAYEFTDPPVVPSGVTFKKSGTKFLKINGKFAR